MMIYYDIHQYIISIHVLREEDDDEDFFTGLPISISIHVLREEDDLQRTARPYVRDSNFNPRPPRGGRRRAGRGQAVLRYFNPRPPRGGRRTPRRTGGWLC